jgi:ABC-type transport system involved in multi-copper enzyme maturation permease subunit
MSKVAGWFMERELASALRARWFWAYSAAFVAAALALTVFAPGDVSVYGYRSFAKALVGLVHLALLSVPLMALFPAAAAVAEERENGVLEYLLAQPVDRGEVYSGKWMGLSVSVLSAITLGYAVAAGAAIWRGVPWTLITVPYLFVTVLASTFVSLGLWLSSANSTRARATTFGIVIWLIFAALGSLGLMLTFVRLGIPQGVLLIWSLVNPVEAFRLGVIAAVDPDLSLLGPVGAAVVNHVGTSGVQVLTGLSLSVWTFMGWWAGHLAFQRTSP